MNNNIVLLSLVLLSSNVYAHTTLTTVVINGVPTNDCVRPINMMYYTYPMQSGDDYTNGLNSDNYTCGFMPYASQEAPSTCVANAGDTIQVGWGNAVEQDTYPILIENHKGPIIIYMAKHTHGSGGFPSGNAWFKVFQMGLTRKMTESEQWDKAPWAAPYTLYANTGKVQLFKDLSWAKGTYQYGAQPFKIPADLPAGDYLIRTEIISLHANTPDSGPHAQLYVGCAQIRLTSGGNGNPTDLVSFPGAYPLNIPAFTYVPWRDQVDVDYPFPGPSVYVGGGSPVTPPPTPAPVTPTPVTPTPVTPPPISPTDDDIIEFFWTSRAATRGSCVQITEPEEPQTASWNDNYLCALNADLSNWVWTSNGTESREDADEYNWIQWVEPSDPNGWDNNFLGTPILDSRKYAFSSAGKIPSMTCIRTRESRSKGWNDNYWCTAVNGNGVVNVGVNGVYNGPSDEDSENYASSASVLVRSFFALFALFALLL